MAGSIVAKLENVAKFYSRRLIFKNVSLDLQAGEAVLLTGDNGAGKTTLLRLLAGLGQPDAGHVSQAASVACLAHETCLYPALTALENLEFWTSISGQRHTEKDLLNALEEMNLLSAANEPCRHFSRGMAQRLNFARVLLSRPALLLLDEPFTGMDSKSYALTGAKLQKCLNEGMAMVMTSHDPERDAIFAVKFLHLEKGRATLHVNGMISDKT